MYRCFATFIVCFNWFFFGNNELKSLFNYDISIKYLYTRAIYFDKLDPTCIQKCCGWSWQVYSINHVSFGC